MKTFQLGIYILVVVLISTSMILKINKIDSKVDQKNNLIASLQKQINKVDSKIDKKNNLIVSLQKQVHFVNLKKVLLIFLFLSFYFTLSVHLLSDFFL